MTVGKLIKHYRKLWFYNLNRFKGNNYAQMREYFAHVLIEEIEPFLPLHGKAVLDVGGARGEFCQVLHQLRQCQAINLDPNPGDFIWPATHIGYAEAIPFEQERFDLVLCRGVLEHIPTDKQQASINEMYRVIKFGGFCYLMIPPWFNPHAGHQLKPFHVLPFQWAKALRQWLFRERIHANSLAELPLYKITFRHMLKLIAASNFKLVATRDTHFRLHFLTRVPLLREILVPAVAFILSKK